MRGSSKARLGSSCPHTDQKVEEMKDGYTGITGQLLHHCVQQGKQSIVPGHLHVSWVREDCPDLLPAGTELGTHCNMYKTKYLSSYIHVMVDM